MKSFHELVFNKNSQLFLSFFEPLLNLNLFNWENLLILPNDNIQKNGELSKNVHNSEAMAPHFHEYKISLIKGNKYLFTKKKSCFGAQSECHSQGTGLGTQCLFWIFKRLEWGKTCGIAKIKV